MTYYFQYISPDNGRKNRYRIGRHGTVTPQQARDAAESLSAKVTQGIDPQTEKKAIKAASEQEKYNTLAGFLEHKYGPWVSTSKKTGEATLKRIEYNFSSLLNRPLADINNWAIEKWRSQQQKAGKLDTSINRDVGALLTALNKAVEWKIIDANPLADLKPLEVDNNPNVRYLSADEERRLRAVLSERDERKKAERDNANRWRRIREYKQLPDLRHYAYGDHLTPLVLLTLNTGLRRGEAFSITWDSINFHTRTLTVRGPTAKTKQTRHIPLNDEAMQILTAWREQSISEGLVFPGRDGNRLDNVRTSWGNVLKTAGIANFRWHDLQHDFASKLVMASVPLNTVRELMGHKDLKTTLRYAHLAPQHKAKAVAMLGS